MKGKGMTAVRVFTYLEIESHVYHVVYKELIKILGVSEW